jgi:hypothetical protein
LKFVLVRIIVSGRSSPPAIQRDKELPVTARMTIPLCLFIALAAVACGSAQTQRGAQPGPARPPAVYTVGRTLLGIPGHNRVALASAPVTPLAGWLTPAAVPSPDGRYVAYNAWRELRGDDPALSWEDQGIEPGDALAWPSIRLYDLEAGTDDPYVVGGFSLAWRGDGAIAYFKGAGRDYRAGVRYVGNVYVRESVRAPARRWTTKADRYVVVGWAGQSLLVYREREGEALDVLAVDGPGKSRVLARDAGLVAVSPDGQHALVEHGPESGPPRVELLAVADGAALASLDLTTVDPSVGVVSYAGDWQGDLVAAPSASGLAVFRVTSDRIELVRSVRAAAGQSIAEPRFAGSLRVIGWTSSSSGGAFIDCDRLTGRCARAVPLPTARGVHGFPAWRRPVYNPSRPQEGEA